MWADSLNSSAHMFPSRIIYFGVFLLPWHTSINRWRIYGIKFAAKINWLLYSKKQRSFLKSQLPGKSLDYVIKFITSVKYKSSISLSAPKSQELFLIMKNKPLLLKKIWKKFSFFTNFFYFKFVKFSLDNDYYFKAKMPNNIYRLVFILFIWIRNFCISFWKINFSNENFFQFI